MKRGCGLIVSVWRMSAHVTFQTLMPTLITPQGPLMTRSGHAARPECARKAFIATMSCQDGHIPTTRPG